MTGDPSNSARRQNGATPYIAVGAEIGAYRIESYLDRGGMASVYEATDLRLNRHVALKVLGQELSEGSEFRSASCANRSSRPRWTTRTSSRFTMPARPMGCSTSRCVTF